MSNPFISRRAFLGGVSALAGYQFTGLTELFASETKFPFKVLKIKKDEAFDKWKSLRSANSISVIVGDAGNLGSLKETYQNYSSNQSDFLDKVLNKVKGLRHPESLFSMREKEDVDGCLRLQQLLKDPNSKISGSTIRDDNGHIIKVPREILKKILTKECEEKRGKVSNSIPDKPDFDNWPDATGQGARPEEMLPILYDNNQSEVSLLIFETNDPTTVPAHIRFGGWNANPFPEYHVAALRSWRDRYGAELVGMKSDVLIMQVKRKPATKEEAYKLAIEQYKYCNDVVDQGMGSVQKLAAWLMVTDAWYFWWD